MDTQDSDRNRPDRTRVVILGGGTAGWMAAAALIRRLPHTCTVHLIESAEIGIVGVGEATLPHLRSFIALLGIDEATFMQATNATYKLGIEFHDFGTIGSRYLHPFGSFGTQLGGVPFHQYWLRMRSSGSGGELWDYSIANLMADARRFAPPASDTNSMLSTYSYAYQFDATRFAPFLRDYAQKRGVRRTEGRVIEVLRESQTGDVSGLHLESGERVEGDLFVDCSGFRALLIGETLQSEWQDWSHWLPCDRAVAMPCASPSGPIEPFTRAVAMKAGWRWRIPLSHRVGNGYVYSSAHTPGDDAATALVSAVEGEPLAEPRVLRFRAGRRTHSWHRNVVAIGLASGFLEPLESTSIYLAQGAIEQLIALFPIDGRIADADRAEFNRLVDYEYDRIRDFLILHYHATSRDDSPFWNEMRTMKVPDSLHEKMELFRAAGRIARYTQGLFLEPSWLAVFIGQGVVPRAWDSRVDSLGEEALGLALRRLRQQMKEAAAELPDHADFLKRHGRPATETGE